MASGAHPVLAIPGAEIRVRMVIEVEVQERNAEQIFPADRSAALIAVVLGMLWPVAHFTPRRTRASRRHRLQKKCFGLSLSCIIAPS